MEAATHGKLDAVDVLLAAGAQVDVWDDEGGTPLVHAAKYGHAAVVTALLAGGAYPDARYTRVFATAPTEGEGEGEGEGDDGAGQQGEARHVDRTALIDAAARGDLKIVEVLLAGRADPEAQDEAGLTSVVEAATNGHNKVLQALLAGGAYVPLELRHMLNDLATGRKPGDL